MYSSTNENGIIASDSDDTYPLVSEVTFYKVAISKVCLNY